MATAYANTNIYPLPTAAKKKVQNPGPLSPAIETAHRLPVEFDFGGDARTAQQESNYMRSPEMMIITAIFKLLPDAAKEEIRKKIATVNNLGLTPHSASALHIVECMK